MPQSSYLSTDPNAGQGSSSGSTSSVCLAVDAHEGTDDGVSTPAPAFATRGMIGPSDDRAASTSVAPGLVAGAVGAVGAAAAPAVVAGVSRAARIIGTVASGRAGGVVSRVGPAVAIYDAAQSALQGDIVGAAQRVAGGAAVAAVPRAARAVAAWTAPAVPAMRDALTGRFISAARAPGLVARGASAASRWAGPIGLIGSMVTDPGDRPHGETPETTAARQAEYQRQYDALIERDREIRRRQGGR